MALTQSEWTGGSVNGRAVWSCTVAGTDDTDLITKRTPAALDTTKPWSLTVITSEDMTAAGASAVDIWGCYTASASLAAADAATGCVLVHSNSTDLDAGATEVIHVYPAIHGGGTFTQVTNALLGFALIPAYPYFIINVDMTAGLQDAAYATFIIVQ